MAFRNCGIDELYIKHGLSRFDSEEIIEEHIMAYHTGHRLDCDMNKGECYCGPAESNKIYTAEDYVRHFTISYSNKELVTVVNKIDDEEAED